MYNIKIEIKRHLVNHIKRTSVLNVIRVQMFRWLGNGLEIESENICSETLRKHLKILSPFYLIRVLLKSQAINFFLILAFFREINKLKFNFKHKILSFNFWLKRDWVFLSIFFMTSMINYCPSPVEFLLYTKNLDLNHFFAVFNIFFRLLNLNF